MAKDVERFLSEEDMRTAERHKKRCSASLVIRKMETEATMRRRLAPVRMAVVSESAHQGWRGCGEKGALALRCRDRVGAAAVEDSVQATQVSTDEWIEKMQCVYMHTDTHTHTGVLRSNKKERNLATCDDVDGP